MNSICSPQLLKACRAPWHTKGPPCGSKGCDHVGASRQLDGRESHLAPRIGGAIREASAEKTNLGSLHIHRTSILLDIYIYMVINMYMYIYTLYGISTFQISWYFFRVISCGKLLQLRPRPWPNKEKNRPSHKPFGKHLHRHISIYVYKYIYIYK